MNPRLVGGEMLLWSDLDGNHGPGPVRGPVLAPLLATAGGRTLVAGPHDPALIDAVPADDLTLLIRGVPDAETLAARYADRPGVTVWCGSPEKLAGEPAFDTIIALDGLGRLSSAEGRELSWQEAFELLLAVLRPDGRLLLGVENLLGLHRMATLRPEETDSAWVMADEYDLTRPAGRGRVQARLGASGFGVTRAYAAYPDPAAPTALLGAGLLADDAVRGFVETTLDHACVPLTEVLLDTGRLAINALRHGVVAELAPAWILLAQRGTAGASPAWELLPEALIADGSASFEVRREHSGRWTRHRDGDTGDATIPEGPTLESMLLGACLRRDLPTVRELLGAWQAGPAAGARAEDVIVDPGGGLVALVPAGEPAVAVRGFAATLIRGAFGHPWPGGGDVDDLALTLAAVAGRELGDTAGGEPDVRDMPDARAFRELAATRDRLSRELAEARATASWYEQRLTSVENSLDRAQRLVELLSDSGPARAGMAFVGGIRVARRTARVVVRRLRPRD